MSARLTLAESVAAALRHAIVTGTHVCGERLTEIGLAREMNVSQNTVRDALRLLEHEGWVVKLARRGVYIRDFTREQGAEVYALLLAVESVALDDTCRSLSKTEAQALRRALHSARSAAAQHQTEAATETLLAFHETLVRRGGGTLTSEILRRLYNYARLLEAIRHARAPGNAFQLEVQIGLHEQLLQRVEAGDCAGARETLSAIVSARRERVLPLLQAGA